MGLISDEKGRNMEHFPYTELEKYSIIKQTVDDGVWQYGHAQTKRGEGYYEK